MGERDCIFCKIVAGEIPADIVFDDDRVVAFRDIDPQAPTHVVVIPRQHIESLNDLSDEQEALMGHLQLVLAQVAAKEGLSDGYRVVANCGAQAGQLVPHVHYHLLGGRSMEWPPG